MNKIFEKLTNQMNESIDSSVALALHNKNQEVEVIHMLWALLTNTNSVLNQLLNKMNIDKTALVLEAKSYTSSLPTVSTVTKENIKLSRNLIQSLEKMLNGLYHLMWPQRWTTICLNMLCATVPSSIPINGSI